MLTSMTLQKKLWRFQKKKLFQTLVDRYLIYPMSIFTVDVKSLKHPFLPFLLNVFLASK